MGIRLSNQPSDQI